MNMKHLIFGLFFITTTSFAQGTNDNCAEVVKENTELKEKMHLFLGKKFIFKDSLSVKFIAAEGNIADSTIELSLIVENFKETIPSTVDQIYFTDEVANEFKSIKILPGADSRWKFKKMNTNVPFKVKVLFSGVSETSKFVRNVHFVFNNPGHYHFDVALEGDKIIWK
jgi:hypothetical protein